MSLWKYVVTGAVSAAAGASLAVGTVYLAADNLLGEAIDERTAPEVTTADMTAAQKDMAHAIANVLAQTVMPRIEQLEGQEFTVRIGTDCPLSLDAFYPQVVTDRGRAESICIVTAP